MITKIKIHGYRIFRDFDLCPHPDMNILVGANEAGKSTLIEATALALTGRINGRSAPEELNPYWFNASLVQEFLDGIRSGRRAKLPEISIELFFQDRPELQRMSGAINSEVPTIACPGISLKVLPNPEYMAELAEWQKNASNLLPVEYYSIDWRTFSDEKVSTRPRQLATAIIDSRTVKSTSGVDFHLRQILGDHLEPIERAAISVAYRNVKASMSSSALLGVNQRLSSEQASLHDTPVTLAMDQSARSSWEWAITPHIDKIPFSMSGQGQQAAIKISLAMNRQSDKANFVMIEEPENHLSHTSLTKLLSRVQKLAHKKQQLFISTHSPFVLNRLGLDALLLIGNGAASKLATLDPSTVAYFQKLPGYDTLRLALARKIVLVEGPSDEILFERVFADMFGKRPMECEIDVLSMRGLSLRRCLELCSALDKKVAALRDNDGIDPAILRQAVSAWLTTGRREIFIGDIEHGETLEPQIRSHNEESALRRILGVSSGANLATWMEREKTESALRIAESEEKISPPAYISAAANFING
jgi:putative ATP-dependent endonuclease of the OLD family